MKSFVPGLRIIKTFVAVSICLFISYLIDYEKPIYASIACILMMKESCEETKKQGINRVFGTLIGGLVSLTLLTSILILNIDKYSFTISIIASISVLINLIICKGFAFDSYVSSMSCVVSLITLLSIGADMNSAYHYIIVRTLETVVGIIIAFLTNRYFNIKWGENT